MFMLGAMLFAFCLIVLGIINIGNVDSAQNQDCSPYPFITLDNGQIIRSGYQVYSFKCDEGYFLASASKVRCYKGNWTSTRQPKCLKKGGRCDEPPMIPHGVMIGADRTIGGSARYVCGNGFTLVGPREITCSAGGYWRGRTPTCMDESEPLEKVAERLKNSFVNEIGTYTKNSPEGRLLDRSSTLNGLELVLLLDRSSSVDPIHMEDAKNFVKFLLRRFGVKNGAKNKAGTRAAVLTFGTTVQVVFNLDNNTITGPLAASIAVDSIQANGGGTNMEGALTYVITKVASKLRPKAKRALFLMTDGEPNIANPEITPQDIARQLKGRNYEFEIFTVGIGKGINQQLLSEIASEPPISHVFVLNNYPDLNKLMKIVEDDTPPAPPITRDHCGYKGPGEDRPWLAVVYVGSDEELKLCGGVLICSRWVLTAATCMQYVNGHISKKDIFVSLGERNLLRDEQNQTNFYVVDVNVYPNFDPSNDLQHNLALIKLNLPASRYRPACLPRTDQNIPLHLDLNINASIAGWGLTPDIGPVLATGASIQFTMDSNPVSLSEDNECPGRRRGFNIICAGQGFRTCLGLIGSPLMAEDSTTGFNHILGILTNRTDCYRGNNQYVELTNYLRWINQQTNDCQLKHWGINN